MLSVSTIEQTDGRTTNARNTRDTPKVQQAEHHPGRRSPPRSDDGGSTDFADTNGRQPKNLVKRLMSDMDPDLLAFLKTNVDTFIKWDLIHFFHNNPHTLDTAENIARYAGRDVERIAKNLEELAGQGILNRQRLHDMSVYSPSNDPETQAIVDTFVKHCQDRQFRIKAIYYVIHSMH